MRLFPATTKKQPKHLRRFKRFLTSLPIEKQKAFYARLNWLKVARSNQIPPPKNIAKSWHTWLLLAGRGFGKTRAGAEEFSWQLLRNDGWRGAIVAPTMNDARDTCIEGDSGLLNIVPFECIDSWNRSQGEMTFKNGSKIKLFSADAPERLRGPQHHVAWCDELGAWANDAALEQLRFGLRLGTAPKMIITTTPRPNRLILNLLKMEGRGVVITRGNTFENKDNLAAAALEELSRLYENTRMGRQELYAELLLDTPGALWSRDQLDSLRIKDAPATLERLVVGVDPAVTAHARSDKTGIVACGLDLNGHAYVLRDETCSLSPDGWARRVIDLYHQIEADVVVGEVNQGGDLVESILRTIYTHIPFKSVRAHRSKIVRAQPVAALYEQGLVHHVGYFSELEEEMCRFSNASKNDENTLSHSPDRIDALVIALTELMLNRITPRVCRL